MSSFSPIGGVEKVAAHLGRQRGRQGSCGSFRAEIEPLSNREDQLEFGLYNNQCPMRVCDGGVIEKLR